jgi:cytochrome oxidase assembly protein ShyY1
VYRFLGAPRWLGGLALALALATVLALLGFWQLGRYQERSRINARIDAAITADPAPLGEVVAPPRPGQRVGPAAAARVTWSVVSVTGRFDAEHQVLVRNRTVSGRVGYEVLTPLVLGDGTAVIVDRGWLPPSGAGAAVRPDVPPPPPGQVTVVGRVRPSEPEAGPVAHHQGMLQTGRINVEALAPHLPYPLYGAYLLQQAPADPALTAVPVRHENAWLNGGYAVQWWIFSVMALAGFLWLARREAQRRARVGPAGVERGRAGPAGGGRAPPTGRRTGPGGQTIGGERASRSRHAGGGS